jgi:hypothetical protein
MSICIVVPLDIVSNNQHLAVGLVVDYCKRIDTCLILLMLQASVLCQREEL